MNRRDAETQRFRERSIKFYRLFTSSPFLLFALCLCVSAVNFSCTTKPSDLRTLVPAETLIYLETNDLAAALQPIVDSKPFREVAKSKPDFSALKGVQVAVAVTGFETSEIAVTDEQAVGKVQPRFVAVADTHAWNYQAVAFAEKKLGSFVTEIYDAEPKLEKSDKHGGKYFTWTSQDGRKAFALVIDSLIYFGNDETAIDKALAVRNGQAESIAKTGKLPPHVPGNTASGYVSTDGVAQIAALAGLHFASQASDEEEVQSAVAGILPQLIRGTVTDITWSTSQTSEGIEDKWSVRMPDDISRVFNESVVSDPSSEKQRQVADGILSRIPADVESATRYNLKSPQVAWRSVLLVSQSRLDAIGANVVGIMGNGLFEPYGIEDPELFLSSLGGRDERSSNIVTVRMDVDSDESVMLSMSGNHGLTQKSFVKDMKTPRYGEDGYSWWSTSDGDTEIDFERGPITLGPAEEVKKIRLRRGSRVPDTLRRMAESDAPIVTIGRDHGSILPLISFLAREGHGDTKVVSTYLTETRFTKTGMERRTVSDFGFIGWMIAQLAAE